MEPCSGCGRPGVHGSGDRVYLAAGCSSGRSRGHRLQNGQFRLQQRHHPHLHAETRDALHDGKHTDGCVPTRSDVLRLLALNSLLFHEA